MATYIAIALLLAFGIACVVVGWRMQRVDAEMEELVNRRWFNWLAAAALFALLTQIGDDPPRVSAADQVLIKLTSPRSLEDCTGDLAAFIRSESDLHKPVTACGKWTEQ